MLTKPPGPGQVAAQQAAHAEAYLRLPEDVEVQFVDRVAGVEAAIQSLGNASVLGIDVEWRPCHLPGTSSPASILQVCRRADSP